MARRQSAAFGSAWNAYPPGLAKACAAVALLATASFFLLHHVGNQIPYDLAVQRFKAEMESDRPDEGHAEGYKGKYEYCEISGAVIAGLLWGVLWIVGLISISSATFLIAEHHHYRTARFAFVPLALCLSCLVLSLGMVEWSKWKRPATMRELPVLLVVAGSLAWYLAKFELSATAKAIESVDGLRPVVSSTFDVYLDGNRLVYVKEECGDEDYDAPFFLHVHPVDVADLPVARRPHGFDNLDFHLSRGGRRDAGRCTAVRNLPDYGIVAIHTGQFLPGKGPVWSERISIHGPG